MKGFYPEIEPNDRGMLEVGDGNVVYREVCGNPRGKPAIVLHGGPGSGCTDWHRRLCDPNAYRIVLFDQRGCGRSRPHASAPDTNLASNHTWSLVADWAWDLHRAWPRAELVVVDTLGHAANSEGITEALVRATDRFAARR